MWAWILLLAYLSCVASLGTSDVYSDTPDQGFIRRAYHSSTMIDDKTLIVDGGEIAQYIGPGKTITNLPLNFTLSIDMSKSWDTSFVPWTAINKNGSYPFNEQTLWPSKDGKTCYAFGGRSSYLWTSGNLSPSYTPKPVAMYQLDLADQSSGSWTGFNSPHYQPADQSLGPQPLNRPSNALGATVDNTGFIIGGSEESWSQAGLGALSGAVPIPGIASYNITSNQWSNDTTPPNVANTFLQDISSFGPSGLLISSGSPSTGEALQVLNNITIYEPISKTWHMQTTTGSAPAIRNGPCTVGVQGDNGTYEIFLYAGELVVDDNTNLTSSEKNANEALDEVWVLSLPAFAWFKANYSSSATRYRHTCNLVGKSQMLSLGGLDPNDQRSLSVDPAPQGIRMFDLTAMRWSQGYNASAEPYVSPQVVKEWYSNNETPHFNDPALGNLLKPFPKTSTSSSSTSTANPVPATSNLGTIAGGLIGGFGLLIIISGLLRIFLRRRKQRRHQRLNSIGSDQEKWAGKLEGSSVHMASELHAQQRRQELPGRTDGMETPEMDAEQTRHELQGRADGIETPEMDADQTKHELQGREGGIETPEMDAAQNLPRPDAHKMAVQKDSARKAR